MNDNIIRNTAALHYWQEQQEMAERRKQGLVDLEIDIAFAEHELREAMRTGQGFEPWPIDPRCPTP